MPSQPSDPGASTPQSFLDPRLSLDLICFSHLRWDFVTQRPQHLLTRASQDRRVFFWEEPIWHQQGELPNDPDDKDGNFGKYVEVTQRSATLWVVRPHLTWGIDFEVGQRQLLNTFIQEYSICRFVRWYYTPMALGFSAHLPAVATVYDCMDELTGFHGAPPQLAERENQLFAAADVVFTGGQSLYQAKSRQHTNVYAFPSSVDVDHFAQAKNSAAKEPEDQAGIPHPRAGFFGVLDERLDIELLGEVARLRPDIHFVLIGPVVKIDPAALPKAENIHYLGSKSYDQLPAYLSGWDVALLPFALNEATRFISPTKTPEYLAAGKTVVSTPIQDVVTEYGDTGLVAIAATPPAFAEALDQALMPQPSSWCEAVELALAKNSWDLTWTRMKREIDHILVDGLSPKQLSRHSRLNTHSHAADVRISNVPAMDASMMDASMMDASMIDVARTDAPIPDMPITDVTVTLRHGDVNLAHYRYRPERRFDYLVVGAGFAGSVIAERLASQCGKRVLIIDKRDHIGGNAYDHYNEDGLLIHKYGPHIFHTNSDDVVNYLSQFTEWRPYEHRVLASVASHLLPIPINLDTVNRLYNLNLDSDGMRSFLDARTVPFEDIKTSEQIVISRVGIELYELFFRNYTRKQWGLDPSQLDASVAGRVPVRFDRDDRYFSDRFQAMPLKGYTPMFERMLDHPRITVQTETTFDEASQNHPEARIIYTGPIDEYFGFRFGPLPYRSLEFKHQTLDVETYQQAPVINYPNEHSYTRVTEFKYLTGQQHHKTSLVYEYPKEEGDPYYPIPRAENTALYARYLELAQADQTVTFCGRLATYRYLNMDQVVAQALSTFRRLREAAENQSTLKYAANRQTKRAADLAPVPALKLSPAN